MYSLGAPFRQTWNVGRIPGGLAGTRATVAVMRRLAAGESITEEIRDTARELIEDATASDTLAEVRALQEFVRDEIRYTRDPVHAELVQSPRRTLRAATGDCDDKATLLSALLQAIGVQVRYVLAPTNAAAPRQFTHVYLEALVRGAWVPLETIVPGAPVGYRPRAFGPLLREG